MLNPVFVGGPLPSALNEERTAINNLDAAVAARIPKPAGANVGDLLRFDGTNWVSTTTRTFEGEGPPNGIVAAPVGSRYVDTVGTRGAVEWVKQTGGAGNTGWLCLTGNTGRRNIASLIDIGNGTVNAAYITRIGSLVDLYLDVTMPSNKTATWSLYPSLAGFGPGYSRYGALNDNTAGNGSLVVTSGGVALYSVVGGVRDRFAGTWLTQDVWPAALPGIAA